MNRTHKRSTTLWSAALATACLLTGAMTTPTFAQPNASEEAAARRAATEAARGQLDAARMQAQAASERVRAAWTSRPEMLQAQMELEQARIELDRVSAPSFEKLRNSDAYKQALKDEEEAAKKVASEQAKTNAANPSATQPSTMPAGLVPGDNRPIAADETDLNIAPPTDDQIDAAAQKLEVVTARRKMEMDAARSDPATAQARARFDKATAEVKALQAQMRAAVLNDPEYKAAQERMAAARAEVSRAANANY